MESFLYRERYERSERETRNERQTGNNEKFNLLKPTGYETEFERQI